jgi:GT2 family glycosyltransferase
MSTRMTPQGTRDDRPELPRTAYDRRALEMTTAPNPAPVAVIVVNLNGGELVERTLESLVLQTVPPARTIVVDNGSGDGSADRIEARFPQVELMRLGHNAGFAAANNVAVGQAEDCTWVALLNPDAFPEPSWLEALLEAAAREPQWAALGSCLLLEGSDGLLDGTGDEYHVSGFAWRRDHRRPVTEQPRGREEIFAPSAAAALYRRDAFLAAGGLDERFFCYLEDVDLGFRLRLRGMRSVHVPDAVVRHVGSSTTGRESAFQIYHSQRNLVWTWVKDMPGPLLWLYLPQHLLVNALMTAWFVRRGLGRAVLRAKLDALRGLRAVLASRRAVQRERTVSTRELCRSMARGLSGYRAGLGRTRP